MGWTAALWERFAALHLLSGFYDALGWALREETPHPHEESAPFFPRQASPSRLLCKRIAVYALRKLL